MVGLVLNLFQNAWIFPNNIQYCIYQFIYICNFDFTIFVYITLCYCLSRRYFF